MAVCRAFQRTGEFKWELVKRKDWQLSSTTWDGQRARLFLIHAKLEATVSASVYSLSCPRCRHRRFATRQVRHVVPNKPSNPWKRIIGLLDGTESSKDR